MLVCAEFTGAWHGLSSREVRLINAVLRLNRDHGAGMPAPWSSAVTPRIPLVPVRSHSYDWAGRCRCEHGR
jgi:hypothetical protein